MESLNALLDAKNFWARESLAIINEFEKKTGKIPLKLLGVSKDWLSTKWKQRSSAWQGFKVKVC